MAEIISESGKLNPEYLYRVLRRDGEFVLASEIDFAVKVALLKYVRRRARRHGIQVRQHILTGRENHFEKRHYAVRAWIEVSDS